MDRKRRRSNQSSGTDIPRELRNSASSAFTNYLNRAKRNRTNNTQSSTSLQHITQPPAGELTESNTYNTNVHAPQEHFQTSEHIQSPGQEPDMEFNESDDDQQHPATLLHPTDTDHIQDDAHIAIGQEEPSPGEAQPVEEQDLTQHMATTSSNDNSVVISTLLKHMKKGFKYSASWPSMLSFLSVTGRTRFPKKHYKVLQDTVHTLTESADTMPSYTLARDAQNKFFNDFCFPKSEIHYVKCDILPRSLARNIRKITTIDGEERDARECVKIVKPSAWAKFDLSLLPSYSDIIEGDHHTNTGELSIERSAIVADREHFIGNSSSFWALHNGSVVNIDVGTSIRIPITHSSSADTTYFPLRFEKDNNEYFIACKTGPQWCVTSRDYISQRLTTVDPSVLSADEELLYDSLKSSNLSLDITSNTSTKGNSKSNKKKTNPKNQTAVRDYWSAELLSIYPTDVCVFLRPLTNTTREDNDVICILVSSFVSNITDLPSERIVWVKIDKSSGITAVSNLSSQQSKNNSISHLRTANIKGVPLVSRSNKVPIQAEEERFSNSRGKLANGTDFFTYRFALYADEFGHNGTCGVYILLLGALQYNRISSAGVRVLTLIPKHQNVNEILNITLDDILEGMVHGYECVDPYRKKY